MLAGIKKKNRNQNLTKLYDLPEGEYYNEDKDLIRKKHLNSQHTTYIIISTLYTEDILSDKSKIKYCTNEKLVPDFTNQLIK